MVNCSVPRAVFRDDEDRQLGLARLAHYGRIFHGARPVRRSVVFRSHRDAKLRDGVLFQALGRENKLRLAAIIVGAVLPTR